ncbi:MAG: histidine phosphatase family protein [Congregibacter sp.]
MKTLHVLRHAKSSWQSPGLSDHDRDLNDRGRRDAPNMGRALSESVSPMVIHCSSAVRAQRTLEGLCSAWPGLDAQQHLVEDALYTFSWEELMDWLQNLHSQSESCFLISHNPGLTDLCNQLTGRQAIDNLPTAGYLRFCLPVEHWSDVTPGIAELQHYFFPRSLA